MNPKKKRTPDPRLDIAVTLFLVAIFVLLLAISIAIVGSTITAFTEGGC